MTQPILAQLRDYWEELRAGRLMPLRSEVDPRDMSSFLEVCFALEHSTQSGIRFRLAGRDINDLMGMELSGMPLRSLITSEARDMFDAQVGTFFNTPEIQEYRLISDPAHAPKLTAKLLLLPLKGDNGDVDRAIGCMVTEGLTGVPPRRFRVTALQRTSLVTGLVEASGLKTVQAAATGFAETQLPFEGQGPTPYLRVVK